MRNFLPLFAVMIATELFAGNGMSGGTPPAAQQPETMLLTVESDNSLFENRSGDVGLLTKADLHRQMTVTKNQLLKNGIEMSKSEFVLLSVSKSKINAVGARGEIRSYRISAGDQIDSLTITDRRAAARTSVTQ